MAETKTKPLSGLEAALQVLREADEPMTATQVAAQVVERNLAPNLKGETPKATIAAQLYTAAAKGKVKREGKLFSPISE